MQKNPSLLLQSLRNQHNAPPVQRGNKCTILLLLFRCSLSKLSSALVIRAVLTGASRKSVFWPWELFSLLGGWENSTALQELEEGLGLLQTLIHDPLTPYQLCLTSVHFIIPPLTQCTDTAEQVLNHWRYWISIIGDIGYQSESILWCNVVVYCYFSKHSIYESLFIFWAAFIFSVLFIFLYSFN